MGVIQVAPGGRATAPVKPDAVISAFDELPAALERLGFVSLSGRGTFA